MYRPLYALVSATAALLAAAPSSPADNASFSSDLKATIALQGMPCDQITDANRNCYRAQCVFTAKAIADQIGLAKNQYSISFQSRLGRAKWLGPNTEECLKNLAARGVKRLAVACPSFVADCLETLEEIAIRGEPRWRDWARMELTRLRP